MPRTPPTHVLAHLSDLHLRPASDPLVGGVVDADARLRRAIGVLSSWDVACDAWLFTGDLSDTGDAETYVRLRELVLPAAAASGTQAIWANGNHDDLATLRRVLLNELDADARPGPGAGGPASDPAGPLNREYDLRGLRLITLDSCVPGATHGRVADASLDWLAGRLATPAPHGTILALHHPPVPPVQDAAGLWDLRNAGAVASVIAGSDVRLVIGGHFHQTSFTTLAGVPVAAASSLVYTQDITAGRTLRGQDTHVGFNLVEVYPERMVVTAVQLDAGAGVHDVLTTVDARARLAEGGSAS